MEICILGSCSGTEPQAGRHHTSWVLLHEGDVYWFDAGENCSYTAHLAGIDLLRSKAVYLSHPHLDHVGGLPNLLWTIAKLRALQKDRSEFKLPVYTSSPAQLQAIHTLLSETEFPVLSQVIPLEEGVISDAPVRVEARANCHQKKNAQGKARSFSFRIKAGGKTIVYSGDVSSPEEMEDYLDQCDLLLMENGHHNPAEVCQYLVRRNAQIGHLVFVHHGRTMLKDPEGVIEQCRRIVPFRVDAAYDTMRIKF